MILQFWINKLQLKVVEWFTVQWWALVGREKWKKIVVGIPRCSRWKAMTGIVFHSNWTNMIFVLITKGNRKKGRISYSLICIWSMVGKGGHVEPWAILAKWQNGGDEKRGSSLWSPCEGNQGWLRKDYFLPTHSDTTSKPELKCDTHPSMISIVLFNIIIQYSQRMGNILLREFSALAHSTCYPKAVQIHVASLQSFHKAALKVHAGVLG